MTFQEVKEKVKKGDRVVKTFTIRAGQYYDVYRGKERLFSITYIQFKKLIDGLTCEIECGGLTKHVYTIK